jgi:hypothetical protein
MDDGPHRVDGVLWQSPDPRAWTFLTLPEPLSDELRAAHWLRGFQSLRVRATLGQTTWITSIFPSRDSGAFLLPVKSAVRFAENAHDGDRVSVLLDIID